MITSARLLTDAKALVRSLIDDLRTNADFVVVDAEYDTAQAAGRTALPKPQWAEGLFAQVAVSWVLGAVFVRFCEDNGLVPDPLLSGPGNRRDIARDQRAAYLRDNPSHDDRDWLRAVFTRYRSLPATGDVFGGHNPLWLLQPSADGARELLQSFQRIDPDTGELTHDFSDPTWSTRFLGDLYQDLSDHAKKQYALLQTPDFVEEFILDRTLEPAIKTFGLSDTDLIDPTCGSGHFLLGAFRRLFDHWVDAEPGTNPRELARRALDAVAGVDINPFAIAIARFRLMVAALQAGGDKRLADAPAYPINVAVGDSLLHGSSTGVLDVDDFASAARHGYSTEDLEVAKALLSREWAAVVGNPPYIVVRDPALNELYRKRYDTCRGKYSLGVPFTERFWQLARMNFHQPERAGFVGMITANSFMKREMGRDLIEKWFPSHDLTHLIDTSGAYIPGHGTPTVILFGRNRRPALASVRAVMGIRGEPSTPSDPAKGLVWTSILDHVDHSDGRTEFISVSDLERDRLSKHPWSIGGGGAAELKERLDDSRVQLRTLLRVPPGFMSICGYDEAAVAHGGDLVRHGVEASAVREMVRGEDVRDWSVNIEMECMFPYVDDTLIEAGGLPGANIRYWPLRSLLWNRATFSRATFREAGRYWWEWHQLSKERISASLLITFSNVATHNHFALTRGGRIHNPHAAIVALNDQTSESLHRELLGVLNSSTACFWMQQVFHNKGGPGGGSSKDEKWHDFYEFDGTKLQTFPLPKSLPAGLTTSLDSLATELSMVSPSALAGDGVPTAERLADGRAEYHETLARMIGLQEQLDWETYRLYELLDDDITLPSGEPSLALGHRAFEIVLARKMAAGDETTTWFTRAGSTPIVELPADWSAEYRAVVERRIELIESYPEIALIEQTNYKRRWNTTSWDEQQTVALRGWLLDRLESAEYWPSEQLVSTARLAERARVDDGFMTVARLYVGRDDVDIASLVGELVKAEAVPFVAAQRYKDTGLRKWGHWLHTWDLQRREDAGEDVGEIPVPPKYTSADFLGVAWSHRGKLDVPKERFVSYPGTEREADASLVIGWAGWDHLQRARALAAFYLQAKRDGYDPARLTPLLAGLAELVPWLLQWYDEPNADPALSRPGSQIRALLDGELRALHLTPDDLTGWRPTPTGRGRKAKT